MLAASSKPRAMCSTTWLGDHFPGARGVVQVAADLSAAATRSMTAARLAASTSFKSAMGTSSAPAHEPAIDLNEPASDQVQRACGRPPAEITNIRCAGSAVTVRSAAQLYRGTALAANTTRRVRNRAFCRSVKWLARRGRKAASRSDWRASTALAIRLSSIELTRPLDSHAKQPNE